MFASHDNFIFRLTPTLLRSSTLSPASGKEGLASKWELHNHSPLNLIQPNQPSINKNKKPFVNNTKTAIFAVPKMRGIINV